VSRGCRARGRHPAPLPLPREAPVLIPALASVCVQVTLQRDDGSRTQGAFLCNTSLWDVLKRFEDLGGARLVSECEKVPCVSFMRPTPRWEGREALEGQTLLRLGLVSGSALLKHSFAAPAPDGELDLCGCHIFGVPCSFPAIFCRRFGAGVVACSLFNVRVVCNRRGARNTAWQARANAKGATLVTSHCLCVT